MSTLGPRLPASGSPVPTAQAQVRGHARVRARTAVIGTGLLAAGLTLAGCSQAPLIGSGAAVKPSAELTVSINGNDSSTMTPPVVSAGEQLRVQYQVKLVVPHEDGLSPVVSKIRIVDGGDDADCPASLTAHPSERNGDHYEVSLICDLVKEALPGAVDATAVFSARVGDTRFSESVEYAYSASGGSTSGGSSGSTGGSTWSSQGGAGAGDAARPVPALPPPPQVPGHPRRPARPRRRPVRPRVQQVAATIRSRSRHSTKATCLSRNDGEGRLTGRSGQDRQRQSRSRADPVDGRITGAPVPETHDGRVAVRGVVGGDHQPEPVTSDEASRVGHQ